MAIKPVASCHVSPNIIFLVVVVVVVVVDFVVVIEVVVIDLDASVALMILSFFF